MVTVAHGIPDSSVDPTVIFDDKPFSAFVRHIDRERDVAVLGVRQAPDLGRFAFPIATEKHALVLKKGCGLLAAGYPAREENSPVILRCGELKVLAQNFLRSSCRLTAGDSGGAVFLSGGTLVGINSRIGLGSDSNLHTSFRVLRQALHKASVQPLPATQTSASVTYSSPADNRKATVTLRSTNTVLRHRSSEQEYACCRIDQNRFVAKFSLLPEGQLQVAGHEGWLNVSREKTSRKLDLVLLSLDKRSIRPFRSTDIGRVRFGELTFSGTGQRGIVARADHNEPRARPTLGCTLDQNRLGELTVASVVPHSAAADADLQIGDVLLSLDGQKCSDFDDVGSALNHLTAGDRLAISYIRNGEIREKTGVLTASASDLLDRTEFLDGRSGALSSRRTGFIGVFQHDPAVIPSEMGTAVVNTAGELVGINIAVRSREAVLAIPWATVLEFVSTPSGVDNDQANQTSK